MPKKTILHIIGQLGMGGAERQLYLLLKGLRSYYDFTVISYDEKRLDYVSALQSLGVEVKVIPKRPGITGRLAFLAELTRLVRSMEPDIVQTWLRSANFWGRIACLISRKNTRIIASVRNVDEADMKILEKWVERLLAKRTDLIIANTFAAKESLVKDKIPVKKIRVIYNGIDPGLYDVNDSREEAKRRLSIPASRILIGTVGRMMPQKNHAMFVDAANKIRRERDDIHFLLIGDGELRADIESQIKRYQLDNVFTLTGQRKDIPRLLKAFDIFVLTSLWEGLPNVIMEAMSARLPVVATNVGGVPELISHGENGFLVSPNDTSSMVRAIKRLIDDQELRSRFGLAGRKTIEERFSLDQMCEATSRVYDELLGRPFYKGTNYQ